MKEYHPGLHIIASFETNNVSHFTDIHACKAHFDQLIADLHLTKLGEVYHHFPQGGFTAVIGLTESHLSIHTWPEFNHATFDVFLSNYEMVNDQKAQIIFQSLIEKMEGKVKSYTEIKR